MKLFKSTILAMLGMAVALTSCSDDDKYEPGQKLAGAYFAQGQATEISISPNNSSFDVDIFRTEDAGDSFTVTVADESGLFTVPSTVTFNGNTTTKLTIAYDPSKLELGKPYELTLTVGEGIYVGRNSVNLTVTMEDPAVVEAYEEGTGTYTYSDIWEGDDTGLPITVSYKPINPNSVVWTISNWGYGIDFQMVCEDLTKTDEYGDIPFSVPCQFTGYTHSTYGRVFVADLYTYMIEVLNNPSAAAQFEGSSYYTKETGTFNPNLIYYIPEYEDGGSYIGDYGYEVFQLDGYPEYGVEVTYDGLFTDRNQKMTARATAVCQADVATLKAVMVEGKDAQLGINAILTEAEGVQEYAGAETVALEFPVTKGGDYTIVAVSFDANGEPQLYGSDSFSIVLGVEDDSADWEDMGMADFADGWIIAAFSMNGQPLDAVDYMFSVPVQKYIGSEYPDQKVYRLVQPWGADFLLAGNNKFPANRNLQFMIEGTAVGIEPQLSGFGTTNWQGELTVGNYEGNLYSENEGVDLATCVAFLQSKEYEFISSFEDGVATIPGCMIGAPGIGDGTFGYTWQNKQTALIVLPDAAGAPAARAKAARVAAPKLGTVSSRNAASKVIRTKADKMVAKKANGNMHHATLRTR